MVSIPDFPTPEIYELEYKYWPWGRLIRLLKGWVIEKAPCGSLVLDYMCGTGHLLNVISEHRPDLRLHGITLNEREIEFGKNHFPKIDIEYGDSMYFKPSETVDIAIVTGGAHHLLPSQQSEFIAKVRKEIADDGYFFVGEEVIPKYSDEIGRRLGALKLGKALLSYVIESRAPDLVLEAAVDLLKRDLFLSGEYKVSLEDIKTMVNTNFIIERYQSVWPDPETDFGDVLLCCRPKE